MSNTVRISVDHAIEYNCKSAVRYDLAVSIPGGLFVDYPIYDLGRCAKDVRLIAKFQRNHGLTPDGKLGPNTLAVMCKMYDRVKDTDPYWMVGVNRVKSANEGFSLTCYDQKGGYDLHSVGWFNPKWFTSRPKPKQIVVHWGGLNPQHLYECFSGPRRVSSHVSIGLKDEKCVAYQMLNFDHRAWHAGTANGRSVGVDICQQASLRWRKHYETRGYDVSVMQNDSGRGPKECLTLDPRILNGVALMIEELCDVLGIVKETPDHNALIKSAPTFSGVIGHHHLSPKKWDCAPWWDEIVDAAGLERVRA